MPPITTDEAIAHLAAQGYKTLKPLALHQMPVTPGAPKQPGALDVVVIDSETTGADSMVDQPIEVAGYRLQVGPPGILAVTGKIEMLEEPTMEISEGAFKAHHLSMDDLRGKRFDEPALRAFVEGADLIVAHNAAFDYNILTRRFPDMVWPTWVCSQVDVPWNDRFSYSSHALEYLAMQAGLNYQAHRALVDTEALAETLTTHKVWSALRKASLVNHCVVWATGAPYEASAALKSKGFFWNDPKNDNAIQGAPKAWYLRTTRADLPELSAWMAAHAYGGRPARVAVTDLPGSLRFARHFVEPQRTSMVSVDDLAHYGLPSPSADSDGESTFSSPSL